MLGVRALLGGGLPAMVRVAAALLRVVALDVDSRHTRGIPLALYFFTGVTITIYLYVYHVSTYWFIFTRGSSDVLFCIILFSLGVNCTIGFIKLIFMYLNSKELKVLVSEYLQCDAEVLSNSRMARNVSAALGRVRRRAIIFWILIISNGVVYVLMPILTPGRHLPEDKQILLGWYQYQTSLEPMFESPNYEMAFICECLGVFLSVYAPANITVFLIIVVGYNEAQMLALAEEMLHLWDDAQSHYNNTSHEGIDNAHSNEFVLDSEATGITATLREGCYINPDTAKDVFVNNYVKHRLGSIMKLHAINIHLVKKVESLFRSCIAIEFALLSVALIAELLGGLENTYIEMPFSLVQVSMDCITGQKLIDANKVFEEAVYDCKWENFDVSNMKLVMVILQNAQKTMKLSAGGVTSLNYFSLMSVFRSIYSAYTALRSTMNK